MTGVLGDDFVPNRNDLALQRIARLAILFMNATQPLTTSEIIQTIYLPEQENPSESDLKKADTAFRRDIERLNSFGIHVRNQSENALYNKSFWTVDAETTWSNTARLSLQDVLILQAICQPIANDPSFPWQKELREALLLLCRSFDEAPELLTWVNTPDSSENISLIRTALDTKCATQLSYQKEGEAPTQRCIMPLGIFPLLGHSYVVAAEFAQAIPLSSTSDADPVDTSQLPIKTFRADRIRGVELTDLHFIPPAGFELERYMATLRHPFQIGTNRQVATLVALPGCENAAQDEIDANVEVWEQDGRTYLRIPYANEFGLLVWARACGFVPLQPQELIGSWKAMLEQPLLGEVSSYE